MTKTYNLSVTAHKNNAMNGLFGPLNLYVLNTETQNI